MNDRFDHDSLEVLRDRISGPEIHNIFWKAPYPKLAANHAHRMQEGQSVRVAVGL